MVLCAVFWPSDNAIPITRDDGYGLSDFSANNASGFLTPYRSCDAHPRPHLTPVGVSIDLKSSVAQITDTRYFLRHVPPITCAAVFSATIKPRSFYLTFRYFAESRGRKRRVIVIESPTSSFIEVLGPSFVDIGNFIVVAENKGVHERDNVPIISP